MKTKISALLVIALIPLLLVGCKTNQVNQEKTDMIIEVSYYPDYRIVKIFANQTRGYNYDFYLKIPDNGQVVYNRLMVSSTNTGEAIDSIKYHNDQVLADMIRGWKGAVAKGLNAVLLMPVFPRPLSQWEYYTHSLDRDSMLLRHSKMARLDLQLLAMIDDARSYLSSIEIRTEKQVFIYGFSACGAFANRFTAMHPVSVKAVACGGVCGVPILPISEKDDNKLIYPIGIYDFSKIMGEVFDYNAYRNVAQYIFMGENDKNDAVPNQDAYSDWERGIIYAVLGKDITERWNRAIELLSVNTSRIQLVTYKDIGHTVPKCVVNDLIRFFKANNDEEYKTILPTNAIRY